MAWPNTANKTETYPWLPVEFYLVINGDRSRDVLCKISWIQTSVRPHHFTSGLRPPSYAGPSVSGLLIHGSSRGWIMRSDDVTPKHVGRPEIIRDVASRWNQLRLSGGAAQCVAAGSGPDVSGSCLKAFRSAQVWTDFTRSPCAVAGFWARQRMRIGQLPVGVGSIIASTVQSEPWSTTNRPKLLFLSFASVPFDQESDDR